MNEEQNRLKENYSQKKNWLKWGPYLSERQWGTVREDYSPHGSAWDFFPHDHARSRVYRWGEDGIAGISDHMQRICFSIAFWNGKDPILKERLFGLTGPQGSHGEDCKELYYYLDSTPTHSYMKHLYKYPQQAYPYHDLIETNARRSRNELEYELIDTGIFDHNEYFDIFTEYAKVDDEDMVIKITAYNRFNKPAPLWILPQIWFRNLWSFGLMNQKPNLYLDKLKNNFGIIELNHEELGKYYFYFDKPDEILFTDNENNKERLWQQPNDSIYVKDAFHTAIIDNKINNYSQKHGTKAAPVYKYIINAHSKIEIKLRLSKQKISNNPLNEDFQNAFSQRIIEANEFYNNIIPTSLNPDETNILRQSYAGMLWSKQYYNIDIPLWLNGDQNQPSPPTQRKQGRNHSWHNLNNEDIISMPDKWEYPWYAAWDSAFHCISLAHLDIQFVKDQLLLFLREWYMHPNGQIPAYEWSFSDVNPPVHAMSCLKVYYYDLQKNGTADIDFLKKAFTKLCLNFTWWVNRKDQNGNNVFEGGFLGLDNIGIFDRSSAIPGGGHLEQADGTSWMAMYCLNMLEMALEITKIDSSFEPMATKFFEHFCLIAESLNRISHDWTGSWDEEEGFFYDLLALPNHEYVSLKVRSLVGLTTLFACFYIDENTLKSAPEFVRRMHWFNDYLKKNKQYTVIEQIRKDKTLLTLIPEKRLIKILTTMLNETEFLSDFGIRALSKKHQYGYSVNIKGEYFGLKYEPAESSTSLFGGNSNWRGPIWIPMNYMIIQSLKTYYQFYGDDFKIEFPTGSGKKYNLNEIATLLSERLFSLFTQDKNGNRPINKLTPKIYQDEHFKDLVLFYEYFHGDNGRGVGASHQTGWTGIIADLVIDNFCP